MEILHVFLLQKLLHAFYAGVGHVGEVVDFPDSAADGFLGIFHADSGTAVHDERNTGQLSDFHNAVKIQFWLGGIEAVYGSHRCGQRINARFFHIFCGQFRIRIGTAHEFLSLMAGHDPDLRFHVGAVFLSHGNGLSCHADIFLVRPGGAVIHDR